MGGKHHDLRDLEGSRLCLDSYGSVEWWPGDVREEERLVHGPETSGYIPEKCLLGMEVARLELCSAWRPLSVSVTTGDPRFEPSA